jgi:hypothetical protein
MRRRSWCVRNPVPTTRNRITLPGSVLHGQGHQCTCECTLNRSHAHAVQWMLGETRMYIRGRAYRSTHQPYLGLDGPDGTGTASTAPSPPPPLESAPAAPGTPSDPSPPPAPGTTATPHVPTPPPLLSLPAPPAAASALQPGNSTSPSERSSRERQISEVREGQGASRPGSRSVTTDTPICPGVGRVRCCWDSYCRL